MSETPEQIALRWEREFAANPPRDITAEFLESMSSGGDWIGEQKSQAEARLRMIADSMNFDYDSFRDCEDREEWVKQQLTKLGFL